MSGKFRKAKHNLQTFFYQQKRKGKREKENFRLCSQKVKKFDIKTDFILMSSLNGKRWKDGKTDNVLQLCCSYLWVWQWKSTFYVRPLEQVELSFDVSSGSIYGQFGQSSGKEFCFLSHAKEDEWIKDVCGDHFMYRQNGKTSKSVWYSSNEMSFKTNCHKSLVTSTTSLNIS